MYRYVKIVNLLVHFEAGRKTSDRRTLSVPFTDPIGLSLNIYHINFTINKITDLHSKNKNIKNIYKKVIISFF